MMQDWADMFDGGRNITMKTWAYFYIEHTIKNGEFFRKEPGWALNLQSNYVVLSGVKS